MSQAHWVTVPDGVEKTRLLESRIFEGATDPAVRAIAVELVRTTERNAHAERLARLHRFVRDAVDYHRESVETFQRPGLTLETGGDCDDLVALLAAFAWSLRYPWAVEPVGDPMEPDHYTLWLGSPPSNEPHGEAWTVWTAAEPSAAAGFGETAQQAAYRGAML